MKVKELIVALQKMERDADVLHLWDGEARTAIDYVFMGKTGDCITSGEDQVSYSDDGRPEHAPPETEDNHWRVCKETMIR